MKNKIVSAVIALMFLLFLLLPILLPPHAYAAGRNASAEADLLDINTASADQLKALQGIVDAC
jgi:DNA uptake protein ComE-like DNA-binding protein